MRSSRLARLLRSQEVAPKVHRVTALGADVYLVLGDLVTIIDAGFKGSGYLILQYLRSQGVAPEQVRYLFVTHYHLDHIGGLPYLRANCGGAVGAHELEAPYVAGRYPFPNPFVHPVLAQVTHPVIPALEPRAVPVDVSFSDGDTFDVLGRMEIIHTPGHTPGSVSFYFRDIGLIIVGDALNCYWGRLGLPSRLFSVDMVQAKESIQKLALLDVETICFSHFPPIRSQASAKLCAFAELLDSAS